MAKEIKETKQEVQKQEEPISQLEWLKIRYPEITNDELDPTDLPNILSESITRSVRRFINEHNFIKEMESLDILDLDIHSAPLHSNYRTERYPYFRETNMLTTSWSSHNLNLIAPMETEDFMVYLCENKHNFNYVCNFYGNIIACELYKLTILSDYLTDDLSAEEEELFKTCEKVFLENGIYPRGFEYTPEFKVGIFMNMFYHDEEQFETRSFKPSDFLDRHWYGDFLYNRFKREDNGDNYWFFYSNTYGLIENNIKTVYRMFYNVNKDNIKFLDKDVKDYHLEHSKKLMFLVEICHMILDYWDNLKEETAKKFKLDSIRKVKLSIVNMDFIKKFMIDSYNTHNMGMTFDEFVESHAVYTQSGAITHFALDSHGNGTVEVFISLSQKISSMIYEWCNLSKDEIINNIQITLRHEMGHVVNDCIMLDKNGLEVALYRMGVSHKRTSQLMKHYMNTPEEEKLDHVYWYYTCLPEERKANAVMGLTIEDMYKSENTPIPDDIKKLLEENKQ